MKGGKVDAQKEERTQIYQPYSRDKTWRTKSQEDNGKQKGHEASLLAVQPMVSIVLPTRNEETVIGRTLKELKQAISRGWLKYSHEIVLVDDSDDKTKEIAESLGARIVEGHREGLGRAILDGIANAKGEIVVIMDADLSHSPYALSVLIAPVLRGNCDMTIGSRYCNNSHGKGVIRGWNLKRRIISRGACLLALPISSGVKDTTSGFFAIRKKALGNAKLEPSSWKMMLEILVKAHPRTQEIPIVFEDRRAGASKFNNKEIEKYLKHLCKLTLWKIKNIKRVEQCRTK